MEQRQIATKAEPNESRPWRHRATIIEAHSTSQSRMRIEIVSRKSLVRIRLPAGASHVAINERKGRV